MREEFWTGTDAYLEVCVSETAQVLAECIADLERDPGDPTRVEWVTFAAERWRKALHALEAFRDEVARGEEWS